MKRGVFLMQRIRMICSIIVFILLFNLNVSVYADDISEEIDVSVEELEEILEATAEVTKIPTINSRNAVVYDRKTRKGALWEG